jgi:hypothetical protein
MAGEFVSSEIDLQVLIHVPGTKAPVFNAPPTRPID